MSVTLKIELDPRTDIDEAIGLLETFRVADAGAAAAGGPPVPSAHAIGPAVPDVVTLWSATDERSLSRKFLEALSSDPELLTQLADKPVLRDAHGMAMSAGSMRAVHRNLMKTENRLIAEGRIADKVVAYDWDRYETEGAGRYRLASADVAALDAMLGR